jgi:limonene-1,2-epoxide hydrolase
MADEFDPREMVARFRARAEAVRNRGLPPIEGPDRQRFIEQARTDFMDYAMLGDAEAAVEDGVLVLRVDLRPSGGPTSD